ncbi:MAG: tetratricopeptide repeat protein [Gammaproteobacteria bacterium]
MSYKKSLDDYVDNIQLQLRDGNFKEALKEIQKALSDYPTNPKLYINGGNIFKILGNLDDAESYYTKALSIHKSKEVLNNLSVIHIERRNYDQAISLAKEAIEIDPAYVDAMHNLSLAQDSLGNYDEAEKYSSKACALNNYKDAKYLVLLIRILQNTCNWKDIDEISKMLDQHIGNGLEHPFLSISRTDNEENNYKVACSWAKRDIQRNNGEVFNKKIKLGYLCGEFRNHPTNHLIKNLFKHHNNSNFEVYIFSYNHDDAAREYIENNVYKFLSLNDLDNEKASKLIVDHNLDILIDLTIIITNNRQDIINNNSAKKIISYLGFPGTSGSKIYDYIITDQTVTPLSQQKYYTEKFLYMPRTYQVNDGERIYLNKKLTSKKDHGLPEASLILSCFNQSFKIDKLMFNCWVDILNKVDDAYLWLLEDNEISKNNIYSYAEKQGIESNRVIFAPRVNRQDHLDRLKLSDVTLDTRIYNGHTTTTDSIQCAVPVVTLMGNHFASRVSASILQAVGLNDLITKNILDYKSLVIKLATKPDYLDEIKNKLKGESSFINDFYDLKKFTKELEDNLNKISNS